MQEHILEMKLLKGSPINYEGLIIKPHTLGELIDEIGLDTYYKLVGFVSIKKSDLNEFFNFDEEKLKKTSLFQMLLFHEITAQYIVDFLKFTTRNEEVYYIQEWTTIMVNYDETSVIIDKNNVDKIITKILEFYCVSIEVEKEEEYKPANEQARKLIEKIRKNRANAPKPKSNVDLASIISGVAWKSNNLNILSIWDLTLYQLYDAFYRLEIIDNYDKTLTAIYAGTIDGKQTDLKKQIWFKKYSK